MADKAHDLTDKKLAAMEKRVSAIYARSQREIEAKAQAYFDKFAKDDWEKRKQLQEGKITAAEYKRWRKSKIMSGKRWTDMKQQIALEYQHVNETALAYINGELPEIYALNYNALESTVDGVGGYSFMLTDADTVRNLAATDDTFLPLKTVNTRKYQRWCTTKINAEVLQGVIQGESIDKMAKRLRRVSAMDQTSAIRNARTMVTSAECKGRQDSYERAERDGIRLRREWIATNDGRTRHTHALLDGQLADVDKPFKSELGDIMYPGYPSAHPSNVYNCRCTVAAKVVGFGDVKNSGNDLTYKEPFDIIELDGDMNRKKSNPAPFSSLAERISKKNIRNLAKEAGIDLKGVTIQIDLNEELINIPYTGRADGEKIGVITFFPNAFTSREDLIRTIFHEKVHVEQFREYGAIFVQNNRQRFETEAYQKEDKFIKDLKRKGLL